LGPGTFAALGSSSTSEITYSRVGGGINIQVVLNGVICQAASAPSGCPAVGAPYNPEVNVNPDPDVNIITKMRFSDHGNCYPPNPCTNQATEFVQPGTVFDFDFAVPSDCDGTGTCNALGSLNSVVPNTFLGGQANNVQFFRVRVNDSGSNGTLGDTNDRPFAQQGIFVP
jgi:hypothetical protein